MKNVIHTQFIKAILFYDQQSPNHEVLVFYTLEVGKRSKRMRTFLARWEENEEKKKKTKVRYK